MDPIGFSKSIRGYDPQEVDQKITELRAEITELTEALAQSRETNTDLRLSVIKQVEEASAEAAVVLNHARSEAVRVREAAVIQTDQIIEEAREQERKILSEASRIREEVRDEREAVSESADEIIRNARAQADAIIVAATEKAESQSADAKARADEAKRRAQEIEDDLRQRKIELERAEIEIREQADSYALRVYREADEYARSSERRSLETEKQAEEILHQARVVSREQTANALATSRHYLEEALGLVNTIFSDVNGSLLGVQRIRQILGDSVDRIATGEAAGLAMSAASDKPQPQDPQGDSSPGSE
jgi:cell division septum initiation protein DivIVA